MHILRTWSKKRTYLEWGQGPEGEKKMDVKGYVKKEQMYIDICIECYNATYYLHIITPTEITFSLCIFYNSIFLCSYDLAYYSLLRQAT